VFKGGRVAEGVAFHDTVPATAKNQLNIGIVKKFIVFYVCTAGIMYGYTVRPHLM